MYPVQLCRLSGRLREQARSHSLRVGCQVDLHRLAGRHRRQASSHIRIAGRQASPTDIAPASLPSGTAAYYNAKSVEVSWKVVIRRKKPGVQPLPQGLHTFQLTSYRLDHFYVVTGDQSVPCL